MAVESTSAALRWMVGIVAAVAVIWLLRSAAVVAMPLVVAFFASLVVYPVLVWLQQRLRRHGWAAVPLTMALIVVVQHSWDQLIQLAKQSELALPENLGSPEDLQKRLGGLATSAAKVAWEMVSGLVLVLFLVLLMLLEAPACRRNARCAWGRSGSLAAMVTGIAEKVRQYLFVRTVLGAASAGSAAVWLLLLDVDLVLVWVVLTFLLNYIPNIGSIIAVIPPSLMAFVQHGPVNGCSWRPIIRLTDGAPALVRRSPEVCPVRLVVHGRPSIAELFVPRTESRSTCSRRGLKREVWLAALDDFRNCEPGPAALEMR